MYTVDEEDYSPADFDGVKGLEYGQWKTAPIGYRKQTMPRQKLGKSAIRKCTAVFPLRWEPTLRLMYRPLSK